MKSNNISKTYLFKIGKFFTIAAAFVLLAFSVANVNAQGTSATNPAGDLDQCANGAVNAPPESCNEDSATNAANWVNGNLGASKSHYREGDSIAYRLRLTNLTTGAGNPHVVTIQWDTLKSGKHAIDYLTSYDRTVTDANPCAGPANQFPILIANCNLAGPRDDFPITADPLVTGAGVTPIPGNITLFGGHISSIAYGGPSGADASRNLVITFTADVSNPVLAWGGHIATRLDWGFNNSAVNISGSPYHMRFLDLDGQGGNQDRSLSAAAVIYPALVKIIKEVHATINGTTFTTSTDTFSFTGTGTNVTPNFTLQDVYTGDSPSNPSAPGGGLDQKVFTFDPSVTGNGPYPWNGSVAEPNASSSGLSLSAINCTLTPGLTTSGAFSTDVFGTHSVTWSLSEADGLVCTFVNTRSGVTAATAVVTGTVMTASGKGIRGATVTATDKFTGLSVSTTTDSKGNYKITGLETEDPYTFKASATGYSFTTYDTGSSKLGDSRVINFVAKAAASTK